MEYNMDISRLSVKDYKEHLEKANLLPGRRILWQDIDHNFQMIEDSGITNVSRLKKQLSTPQKIAAFAAGAGIPEDYLTILKREIGSFEQKPVALASFPHTDAALIFELSGRGVKTSKDYFESPATQAGELLCLCDLVRINGVGAVAARAFYEAGYRSVKDVAHADAAEMLGKVSAVNRAKRYYKAALGIADMQFCIDFASLLIRFCG